MIPLYSPDNLKNSVIVLIYERGGKGKRGSKAGRVQENNFGRYRGKEADQAEGVTKMKAGRGMSYGYRVKRRKGEDILFY